MGELHGCKVANGAHVITYMLFIGNSYIYCRENIEEANKVMQLLASFGRASGQRVKFDKSSLFFSKNTDDIDREDMNRRMGILEAGYNIKDLGLPNTTGRNKNAILGFINKRYKQRIQNWEGNVLSRAGKEILLKTVD